MYRSDIKIVQILGSTRLFRLIGEDWELQCEGKSGTGSIYTYKPPFGQHSRDGKPAVEHGDGHREWYDENKLHRTDGPAIEWANGEKSWYLNDILIFHDESDVKRDGFGSQVAHIEDDVKTWCLQNNETY